MIDLDKILDDNWKLERTMKDSQYIYEFKHKPHDKYCPMGRYIKFTKENDDIIIIEDGPYLGQRDV